MKKLEKENKIQEVISSGIKELNGIIDVNTVVGSPIYSGQDTIIPISKVTFSFLSGGGEYGEVKFIRKNGNYPMSAGSGTIVAIKPCGFLVKDSDGNYKILNVANDKVEKLIDVTSDYLNKVSNNYEE